MVFWDVTPYSLIDQYQHFGEICCIHLQDLLAAGSFKYWYPSTRMHGATSQKNVILMFTTTRTSNLRFTDPNRTYDKSYTLNKRNAIWFHYISHSLHSRLRNKLFFFFVRVYIYLKSQDSQIHTHFVSVTFKTRFITMVTTKIHSQLPWSQCFSHGGRKGERN